MTHINIFLRFDSLDCNVIAVWVYLWNNSSYICRKWCLFRTEIFVFTKFRTEIKTIILKIAASFSSFFFFLSFSSFVFCKAFTENCFLSYCVFVKFVRHSIIISLLRVIFLFVIIYCGHRVCQAFVSLWKPVCWFVCCFFPFIFALVVIRRSEIYAEWVANWKKREKKKKTSKYGTETNCILNDVIDEPSELIRRYIS